MEKVMVQPSIVVSSAAAEETVAYYCCWETSSSSMSDCSSEWMMGFDRRHNNLDSNNGFDDKGKRDRQKTSRPESTAENISTRHRRPSGAIPPSPTRHCQKEDGSSFFHCRRFVATPSAKPDLQIER
nr:ethylene-responsive transcription factor RAP2-13-like [Ipomoea trifida]